MLYNPPSFLKAAFSLGLLALAAIPAQAQLFTDPIQYPPLARGSHFTVIPHMATHSFASDTLLDVMTMGYDVISDSGSYSMDYLGPTMEWRKGDSVFITVDNQMMDTTTVHWHGMHIPAEMDGGPHQIVPPMMPWNPYFKIMDEPSTMWYHPHLHHMTYMQVQLGLAGLLRITDDTDTIMPWHYGIDDFPLVVQDKPFDYDTAMMMTTINTVLTMHMDTVNTPGFLGNTYLVNGTWNPSATAPQQVVRYRILNGAQGRSFYLGFSEGADTLATKSFYVVRADAGSLSQPFLRNRLLVNPGERWEILLDLTTHAPGDSLTLWTYMSELDPADGIDGGPPVGSHNNLTGKDFALMRIHVTPTTTATAPKTSIPGPFGPITPYPGTVTNWRTKQFFGDFPIAPTIDHIPYDFYVINDYMYLNAAEEWTLINNTNEAHPFHIHDVHFFITHSNNSLFGDSIYQGPKDVVIVPAYDTVKFMTQYLDFADSTHPYMYHCHILAHEDQGMMHQWVVWDSAWGPPPVGVESQTHAVQWSVYPNPTDGRLWMNAQAEVPTQLEVTDLQGRLLHRWELPPFSGDVPIEMPQLARGVYLLRWNSPHGVAVKRVVRN